MSSDGATPEEEATAGKDAADEDASAGEIVAICLLLVGPLVLIGQGVWWLIYRVWPPLPVSRIFEWLSIPVPSFGSGEWAQKLGMVLGTPMSLVLFALALVICLSIFDTSKEEDEANEAGKRAKLVKLMKLQKKKKPGAA
jgi:hypothetical protein